MGNFSSTTLTQYIPKLEDNNDTFKDRFYTCKGIEEKDVNDIFNNEEANKNGERKNYLGSLSNAIQTLNKLSGKNWKITDQTQSERKMEISEQNSDGKYEMKTKSVLAIEYTIDPSNKAKEYAQIFEINLVTVDNRSINNNFIIAEGFSPGKYFDAITQIIPEYVTNILNGWKKISRSYSERLGKFNNENVIAKVTTRTFEK